MSSFYAASLPATSFHSNMHTITTTTTEAITADPRHTNTTTELTSPNTPTPALAPTPHNSTTPTTTPSHSHSWSFLTYNCCSLSVEADGQGFAFKDMAFLKSALRKQYIICLQETKLSPNSLKLFQSHFSGFFSTNLCILLPFVPIQILEVKESERHIIACFIDNVGKKQIIVNIHGVHGNAEDKMRFLKLIDNTLTDILYRHCDSTLTFLGDFNIHLDSHNTTHTFLLSLMFDYNLTDAYREAFPDPISHPGFTRMNWAGQKKSASRIDGIFISRAHIDKLAISPNLTKTISDHMILQIDISHINSPHKPRVKHPSFNDYLLGQDLNKDIFRRIIKKTLLQHKSCNTTSEDNYQSETDNMLDLADPIQCYIQTINTIVKYSSDQMKAIQIHQYSKENILKQRIRDLELRYCTLSHVQKIQLHDLHEDLQELKRQHSNREIQSRHLNSDLHDQIGSARFFKWQRDSNHHTDINCLQINGTLTNDQHVIDNHIQEHYKHRFKHRKVSRHIQDFEVDEMKNQLSHNDKDILKKEISMSETRASVEKLNIKASPGPLGATASLVQFIHTTAPRLINKVQNLLYTKGDQTLNMKFLKVIPKPGKKDLTNIENYRPLSLINQICKTLDNLMLARMIRVFGSNKLFLPESNYAYKDKVGTADSIHNLLDTLDIIKHTNNTNSALLALDFSKAFDMISHEYIYNFLTFIDCPAEFINFFKVTYTTESALLKGTKLDAFPTKAGIPQENRQADGCFYFSLHQQY